MMQISRSSRQLRWTLISGLILTWTHRFDGKDAVQLYL